MIGALKIHLTAIKLALAGRMAYRGDFLMSAIVMLLVELVVPMITILIYRSGAMFPGWTLYEVLLIQGIFLLAKGIAFPFFCGIVWNTLSRVREGTFDLLLIKPKSVLFMLIITGFDSEDLGKLLGGLGLFSLALVHLPSPDLGQWLQFGGLLILSCIVIFSFCLFMAGSLFKWVGNSRVYEIFDSVVTFGLYPLTIFSKGFQTILAVVVPVAMIAFFPAAALLGRNSAWLLPGVFTSLFFFITGLLFFRWILGKYTSAGG